MWRAPLSLQISALRDIQSLCHQLRHSLSICRAFSQQEPASLSLQLRVLDQLELRSLFLIRDSHPSLYLNQDLLRARYLVSSLEQSRRHNLSLNRVPDSDQESSPLVELD
jgi:hypothetical protein